MAHHQGMSVVAIDNALHDGVMRARFHAEPIIQATELLLQERIPRDVAVSEPRTETVEVAAGPGEPVSSTQRRFTSPHDITPRTHLLSNGRYAVMITAAGSGYSRWREMAVTRWREDVTRDHWGSYVFLRDLRSGEIWSAGYQPSGAEPDRYEVAFSEGRAEIIRYDGTITTTLEVAVPSEEDAEVRRVSITNRGNQMRTIELTTYAEIVLAPPAADDAHPAFSKLFVETEFVAAAGALLATRRPRAPGDAPAWAAHLVVVEGESVGEMQFETDRAQFLGRGRGLRAPAAMLPRTPLSGTVGTVLDPIFSLRRTVRVPPRPSNARPRWPGPRLRWNSAISGSPPATPTSSSVWPIACFIPTRPCVRHRAPSSGGAARRRCCGPTASPAIYPSCWCGSTKPAISKSSGNCCWPTNTGG